MSDANWFPNATARLVDELKRSSDEAETACGEPGVEVEVAGDMGGEPTPPTTVVTLRKEGCLATLLVRVFDPEYRLEVQTVPQTATHAVQAKHHDGSVEWVWSGRSFDTAQLGAEIVRVWTSA